MVAEVQSLLVVNNLSGNSLLRFCNRQQSDRKANYRLAKGKVARLHDDGRMTKNQQQSIEGVSE